MRENGSFRKKQGFTMASNNAIRDKKLSLKAKGLYTLIQSYITMDTIQLTKTFLLKLCNEKETAFNSTWDELKKAGYLKIHSCPAEQGRFLYEYDLLDEADLDNGVYLYRHDKSGAVKSTNLGASASMETTDDHTPDYHPSGNHTSGKHPSGDHCSGNGGSNIILSDKTKDNNIVYNTQSINQGATAQDVICESDGLSEEELREVIEDDFCVENQIPFHYKSDKRKMLTAIKILTDWYYPTPERFRPQDRDFEKAVFDMLVDCLAEMACADGNQTYKGSTVSYAKVIEQINDAVQRDGNLVLFAEQTVGDYVQAAKGNEIRDKRKYMKSVIWNSFYTYCVKFESDFARTYSYA